MTEHTSYSKLRTLQEDFDVYLFDFGADLTRLDTIKTQAMESAIRYNKKAADTGMNGYDTISNEFWRLNRRITMFLKRARARLEKAEKMSEQVEEHFKDLDHNDDMLDRNINRGFKDGAVFFHDRRLQLLHKVVHSLEALDGFLGDLPIDCEKLLQTHEKMSQTSHDRVDRWVFLKSLPRVEGLCSICLDDLVAEDLVKLPCHVDHVFHHECIEKWLERSKTCPLDRKVLFGTQAETNSHAGSSIVPYDALHGRPSAAQQ